ncbi:septum formation inhibitor Maf [Psychroflexus maritimus]|uniref:Septum formation inhibitor Maf n=1 Tax=Psychroflexus maritimus TaxID=2714865 RepID=A0A967ABN2_9FLAO|nr:septum formation inhibitor Maf [Psychroflexus maritimus]NGZ89307.1 septum formation inhibitor Maf [Psychroflexus maritimus]
MKNILLIFASFLLLVSCSTKPDKPNLNLSKEFKDYWYAGEAEISYYELSMSRYGENREGEMYLIFVTEDFNNELQVKTEREINSAESHFKLNWHQNFTTGIYDYAVMQSTFKSLATDKNASKIASSIQEWCGQSYLQLNLKEKDYHVSLHSYFEALNDDYFVINDHYTENQLLLDLRISPELTTQPSKVIPNLAFLQLNKKEIKAYAVEIKQSNKNESILTELYFSELDRNVKIEQEQNFPFRILSWEETVNQDGNSQISKAKLINSMNIDYWNKNKEKDLILRDSLKLK